MPTARPDPDALVAAFAASDFSHDDAAWQEAVEHDRAPDHLAVPQMDAHGNYQSPALTRVIQAYDAYLEDSDRRPELDAVLSQSAAGVQRLLQNLDRCIEEGLDEESNPLQQSARDGFEAFLRGLQTLREAADDCDEDAGEDAVDALQDGSNRIMDAFAFFQKLRLAATMQPCPACQAQNQTSATRCSGCNLVLPGTELRPPKVVAENVEGVPAPTPPLPLTTPNYQRVEKALALWQSGALSDEQLRTEVQAVHANMTGHRQANRAELEDVEGLTEHEQEVTLRILGAIDAALQGSLAALEEMLRFYEDQDAEHLRAGMLQLGPPTQRMIEAFLAMQSANVNEHGGPEE